MVPLFGYLRLTPWKPFSSMANRAISPGCPLSCLCSCSYVLFETPSRSAAAVIAPGCLIALLMKSFATDVSLTRHCAALMSATTLSKLRCNQVQKSSEYGVSGDGVISTVAYRRGLRRLAGGSFSIG